MAFLDRFLGRNITLDTPAPPSNDEQAVERYEYLLRTAKPDTIEKAHLDAFGKLTPQQLDLLFERFTAEPPAGERPTDATPTALAKTATRAEARQPGILTRTLGHSRETSDTAPNLNGPSGTSFLTIIATYAIASTAIDAIFWAGLYGTATAAASTDVPSGDGASSGAMTDFFSGFGF